MPVYKVKMYPNQPNGSANEIQVLGDDEKEALTTAMHHFHGEDWRRQGTYFEVREDREDGIDRILLRAVLKTD